MQTMTTQTQAHPLSQQRSPVADHHAGDYSERVLGGVLAAAQGLMHEELESVSGGAGRQGLLKALVYCYATGIYASSEIETALNRDPNVRFLTGGERYESGQIRQFRRRNVHLIRRLLAQALRFTKGASRQAASGVQNHFQWSMAWMTPSLGPMRFEEEAATLVRRAICDDTALLDE
ncbi:MAG: hypothetical protein RI897_2076 [Verrucomicrobiota bacterium]